ncbi:MAG TPA: NAD(P)-dependent oxidoreductase [Gaiellaceae bacterium]|jgi:3-hydroxyisobutyrate dehydrogenase-like beta-hydroxyacid dehydrogenase|nr:NAD(P)-dependent oxidoreductase [Gaiellaceae bacterium]
MTDGAAMTSGMIGLGNMGGRIARRIHAAGLPVVGFDVNRAQLEASGVPPAESIETLAGQVDVVFLSLPDSSVVEKVVYGEGGLLGCSRSGQIVVDLSTAAPSSTQRIHAALQERATEFVDAGISGGAAAAEKGTLSIMAGGSKVALDAVMPVLDTFSARVYHMGDSGSGHVAKLLNNFLNGISLAATAEVMVAAKVANLDVQQLLDVVNNSSGVNFATLNRFPKIVEGDYLEGGLTSNLMAKDIRLYLDLVRQLEVTSLAGPSCLGAFDLAAALGYGEEISNRVVDALGDLSGGVRIQSGASERKEHE